MLRRRAHLAQPSARDELTAALAALREELDLPAGFSPEARAEAESAGPTAAEVAGLRDLRDVPFVTLDPPGSRDLDQAFCIEPAAGGMLVRYAIADVPAYVRPGGALDPEARRRGQTIYLPDGAVPLHPTALSEGRASLLPGEERTAYVWELRLDADGAVTRAVVERARVRSRARLDYPSAQRAIDAGTADGPLALLPEVGRLRIAQERARGGASLSMPDEEIVAGPAGYAIERRFPLPVEEWNAQLSLATGIAAGEMMLAGRVGVLRTMPEPEPEALAAFRAGVAALGAPWDPALGYGEYLRAIDPADPRSAAVLQQAAALFRGADYAVLDGAVPEHPEQAAIAAPYAHVTAPLRRLVDRWGLAICAALCAGEEAPEWARESLAELPELMRASGRRAGRAASAALDRVEAALLRDRVGEVFDAVVVEVRGERARVQLADPAVTANCELGGAAAAAAGEPARVRVVSADVATGAIALELAPSPA